MFQQRQYKRGWGFSFIEGRNRAWNRERKQGKNEK